MSEDRKYLGMSVRQLGILAGLAVIVCLIFGVTTEMLEKFASLLKILK